MESELIPILASAISGKSFFLVLDDVWNLDQPVNLLLNALKSSASYGFILVTTRDQTVAMKMRAIYTHQVDVLHPKSGWELLCKSANITDIADIRNLEDVGSKIVESCGSLPLAIKIVAGMLATKNANKNEWEKVLKSSAWSIIGLPEVINQALYLSYEDLSPQLKQCFLHCSLHPSGPNYVMHKDDLIQFWIGVGLIAGIRNQDPETIAEDCYLQLIRRHLLEPDPLIVDLSKCTMHDLLRSLGRYLSKEEGLAVDVGQSLPHPELIYKLRHISLSETTERICIPGPASEPLRLRTLEIRKYSSQIGNHTFIRLKYLRVLIINGEGFDSIPESIGDMIHLRMLDLHSTSISSIPESIGSLTNLLTLNLHDCRLLHTLPKGITRLCNLRHLNISDTPLTCVPRGIGGLQKLTEIWGFRVVDNDDDDGSHNENYQVDGWDLQELEGFSHLRRIEISKLERAINCSAVFANKSNLDTLVLEFSEEVRSSEFEEELMENESSRQILEQLYPPTCIEYLEIRNYGGKMLPTWMSTNLSSVENLLPNLRSLQLFGWTCCTDLPPLGSLPNLKYLRIKGASAIVRISSEFFGIKGSITSSNLPTAFPKLEYLIFEDLPNWEEWVLVSDFERENSSSFLLMPCIIHLAITNCPKLRALPEGFQKLTKIRDLFLPETYSMESIQNFQFECETLGIRNTVSMEIVSSLPRVKQLSVFHSHNLRNVNKLDSLKYIKLADIQSEEDLPIWLVTLMEERTESSKDELHLELCCRKTLLERCLKDGPNWPIIKSFSYVRAYTPNKSTFLEYTREPESYYANL